MYYIRGAYLFPGIKSTSKRGTIRMKVSDIFRIFFVGRGEVARESGQEANPESRCGTGPWESDV